MGRVIANASAQPFPLNTSLSIANTMQAASRTFGCLEEDSISDGNHKTVHCCTHSLQAYNARSTCRPCICEREWNICRCCLHYIAKRTLVCSLKQGSAPSRKSHPGQIPIFPSRHCRPARPINSIQLACSICGALYLSGGDKRPKVIVQDRGKAHHKLKWTRSWSAPNALPVRFLSRSNNVIWICSTLSGIWSFRHALDIFVCGGIPTTKQVLSNSWLRCTKVIIGKSSSAICHHIRQQCNSPDHS